jgi:hypothetical protein
MTDLSLPRETGVEKSSQSCPTCGGSVPTVTSPYGSTSVGACPTCWPASASSQLEAQQTAALAVDEPAPVDQTEKVPQTSSVQPPSTGDDE